MCRYVGLIDAIRSVLCPGEWDNCGRFGIEKGIRRRCYRGPRIALRECGQGAW